MEVSEDKLHTPTLTLTIAPPPDAPRSPLPRTKNRRCRQPKYRAFRQLGTDSSSAHAYSSRAHGDGPSSRASRAHVLRERM